MFGFTLMELMIVMGLIMILSVVGIGSFMVATVKSRDAQRKNDLNQMVKAIESFYSDVGHYPLSETSTDATKDTPHCYESTGGIGTDLQCISGGKLYSKNDTIYAYYITIPSDPVRQAPYTYISDGTTFAIYAGLENENDKDLLKNPDGSVNMDPWGLSCGTGVKCNYKLTETGLVKSL